MSVPSGAFQHAYADQEKSQWRWAASLQMLYTYYGLNVPQADIVCRSYGVADPHGTLPNWGGSFQLITANLNGQSGGIGLVSW